ncbi:WhiB family transcriptional regulator [Streptomyces chartreusis]|uniref:WhiB family transcriptional regulator n=1 Tax=Streptomyces chartreusis TaxID=1969 RepID=UPI0037F2012C
MTPTVRDWRPRAACLGEDTDRWFEAPGGQYGTARTICDGCPVRVECLYDALTTEPAGHRYGMWGGLTGTQRSALPALPASTAAALAALRELLPLIPGADVHPPAERTEPPMTNTPAPPPDNQLVTTSTLLRWAADHSDPHVKAEAASAEAALAGLRQRYAADQELTAITTEAADLEKRLAELRAREAELAPTPKKARKPVDYPAAEVRVWAREQNISCPASGRVPKAVVDAWRAAQQEAGRADA